MTHEELRLLLFTGRFVDGSLRTKMLAAKYAHPACYDGIPLADTLLFAPYEEVKAYRLRPQYIISTAVTTTVIYSYNISWPPDTSSTT
jgi:hypothetical protein